MKLKLSILILTIFAIGCTTFHSRMFIKEKESRPVNGLVVNPTVVAYQNLKYRNKNYDVDHDYWIEISVSDPETKFPKKLLHVSNDHKELASARNKFRERVMKNFAIDTVTVVLLPSEEEHRLAAIRDVPGWKWELKYRFGSIPVPYEVDSMRLIIPYQAFDSTTTQLRTDTIEFSLKRYEFHEKEVWAPDIPKSIEEIEQKETSDTSAQTSVD